VGHQSPEIRLESPEVGNKTSGVGLGGLVIEGKTLRIELESGDLGRKRKVFYGRLVSEFAGRAVTHDKNMEHGFRNPRTGMGYPSGTQHQLVNDAQAAETILDKVKSGERTATDVVQCNKIF
jgi:hypothetical protein